LKKTIVLIILFGFSSCANNIEEVNALLDKEEIKSELAEDIELIYSDSALVKMRITAPQLRRHLNKKNVTEVFEKGLSAEFFGPTQRVNAWLDAKYAIRKQGDNEIVVRDSVVLWNEKKEKLETTELIWDETEQYLFTNKFVMITQPEQGDTSFGYGFESNAEFTRFEIKNQFSSKMNSEAISSALGKNNDPKPQNSKLKGNNK